MSEQNMSANFWYRVRLDIPELTNGRGLASLLSELSITSQPLDVVLTGIEGNGDPELGITQLGCVSITVEELELRLKATGQIDWGNFFFFKGGGEEICPRICDELSLSQAIEASSLSIRVIDDSSVDIFTQDGRVATDILKRIPSATLDRSQLEGMDFPQ